MRVVKNDALMRGRPTDFNARKILIIADKITEAVKWFRAAAQQGLARSQYNLAISHFIGNGTPKNQTKAMIWFQEAAQNGDGLAQHNLAIFYLDGEYLSQNIPNAYAWSLVAEASGFPASRKRIEDAYPTADLSAAQTRAEQLCKK